jgi:hypothetical protein
MEWGRGPQNTQNDAEKEGKNKAAKERKEHKKGWRTRNVVALRKGWGKGMVWGMG